MKSSDKRLKKEADLTAVEQVFETHVTAVDIMLAKHLGEVSAIIVKKRIEMNMTQAQFAEYMDVSQGMVSKWESANYNFTVKSLCEIAEKLGMDLHVGLVDRKTDAKKNNVIEFREM